jgi:multidrug resistance efflux pump
VVQQLAVHTIGGVVTPAQTLLVLVPLESHLEVEAMIANRDIGFVSSGQDAEIKVDTFNFTRYGLRSESFWRLRSSSAASLARCSAVWSTRSCRCVATRSAPASGGG